MTKMPLAAGNKVPLAAVGMATVAGTWAGHNLAAQDLLLLQEGQVGVLVVQMKIILLFSFGIRQVVPSLHLVSRHYTVQILNLPSHYLPNYPPESEFWWD